MTENTDTQNDDISDDQTNIDDDLVQDDKVDDGGDVRQDDIVDEDVPDNDQDVANESFFHKHWKIVGGGVGILAILGALLASISTGIDVISLWQDNRVATPTPIPTATPEPFEPAAEGESLIIVLPFHVTASGSSEAHLLIYEAIGERLQELGLNDVRVEINRNTVLELAERESAQTLGERYNAAMVIWGTESRTSVRVNFLNIKEPEIDAGDEQVQVIAPETLVGAQFIEGHLAGQLTFLSLFAVGQAVVAEGHLAAAIPIMEAAVGNISEEMIAEGLAAPEAAADAYFWMGWLYHMPPTQQFQDAATAYEQSLVFAPEDSDSLGNLGLVYLSLSDYETAADYHEQALAIAQEVRDKQSEVNNLSNLGSVSYSLGEYEESINYSEQALAIAQEISDKNSKAASLGNLGNVYYSLGEYETSASYYEQALAIAQEVGDKQKEATNLGKAYSEK